VSGKEEPAPPRLATILLTYCLPPGTVRETVVGDLREMYQELLTSATPAGRAALWYWMQVLVVGVRYLFRRTVHRKLYRGLVRSHTSPVKRHSIASLVSDASSDVRFAFRSFRRNPGFAAATVTILGIGIGAVSLMFSTFNAAVLRPLPFPEPDRLVWVWSNSERVTRNSISYLDFVDYRDGTDAFESLGAFTVFNQTRFVTGSGAGLRVTAGRVSANLFATLGVPPQLGRTFLPEEEVIGADAVVIVSHGFWQRRYGADPTALGSTIGLEGQPAEIVGVMPAGFDFPTGVDLWIPLQRDAMYAQGRGNNNFYAVGRLRDGISIRQAQTQMAVIAQNIADLNPDLKAGWSVSLVSLHERFFGSARDTLLILIGIISLVPLVACANVASLFMARSVARRTELASRLALGASRSRLIRQLVTEGSVMALGGGAVGLSLALFGNEALRAFAPAALPRMQTIGIDAAVVSFTLAASLLTVPLFAMVPAMRATDMKIADTLRAGSRSGTTNRRSGFRNSLVVAQVALSVILMVASGLLLRSYVELQQEDPGFQVEGLLYSRVTLPSFKYETFGEVQQVWVELHQRLMAVPGVLSVGAIDRPPISGAGPTNDLWAAERPPISAADRVEATRRFVDETYFDATRIPLKAGRVFETTDGRGDHLVTVLNEACARQYFPGEDPIGRTLIFDYDVLRELEVIGVVDDDAAHILLTGAVESEAKHAHSRQDPQ
jgi:putative ABC transport system permease protein